MSTATFKLHVLSKTQVLGVQQGFAYILTNGGNDPYSWYTLDKFTENVHFSSCVDLRMMRPPLLSKQNVWIHAPE